MSEQLKNIERALKAAKEELSLTYDLRAEEAVKTLEEALRVATIKNIAEDTTVDKPFRDAARREYNAYVAEAQNNPKKYTAEAKKQDKYVLKYAGVSADLEAAIPPLSPEPENDPTPETAPAAATPATPEATPATPEATTTPAPIPTPADIEGIDQTPEEKELRRVTALAATEKLKDERRERDRVLRDEAYNRMTPAERLQENVREREAQKMANAAGAVAERREQMAADEAYKAQQIAEQGYFREGDTTQFVGQADRQAMQKYFTDRAKNLRLDNSDPIAGGRTSGARPTSNDGLTVMNIPEEYGGGLATGAKPNFGKEYRPPLTDKVEYDFGEDPNKMYSQVSADGKSATPIMTSGQAQSTDSWREGSGINVANTATNPNDPNDWKRAMDAKDAQRIRDAERKRMIDSQIAYALTGKAPSRIK
jgi:hypothetical protein